MANRIFGVGGPLGPAAPGLSGAINPLMFLGSGMATGDMAGAMGQLANIQQQGQQNQFLQQQFQMEQAQHAATQRAAQLAAELAMQRRAKALEMAKTVKGPQRERAILAAEATPDKFAESFVNQEGIFAPTGPGVAEFGDVSGAREKYLKHSAEWQSMRNAYERMAASRPTGAGDISLLIGYMKMLDPGSVVREGEFATAENAGGVGPQVRNLYNRIVGGDRLTAGQRAEFIAQAQGLLAEPLKRQIAREEETQAYGARFGMRPEDITPESVIGDYRSGVPPWTPPVVSQQTTTPTGAAPAGAAAAATNPVDAIQAEAQARIDALRDNQLRGRNRPRR